MILLPGVLIGEIGYFPLNLDWLIAGFILAYIQLPTLARLFVLNPLLFFIGKSKMNPAKKHRAAKVIYRLALFFVIVLVVSSIAIVIVAGIAEWSNYFICGIELIITGLAFFPVYFMLKKRTKYKANLK